MSIKTEMQCIGIELAIIKECQERMKTYILELNKLNPLKIGQDLIVNGYSHIGKTLVAEKVFVSDRRGNDAAYSSEKPVNFTATGTVKKKDGSLGSYVGVHEIKIEDLINQE